LIADAPNKSNFTRFWTATIEIIHTAKIAHNLFIHSSQTNETMITKAITFNTIHFIVIICIYTTEIQDHIT